MFKTGFSGALLGISLAACALIAGCGGGGGGKAPILGADVSNAVLVAPPGAVTPPTVPPPPVPVLVPVVPPVAVPPLCPVTVTFTDPTAGNQAASTATSGVANGGKRITATLNGPVDASVINSSTFKVAELGQPAMVPASVGYEAGTQMAAYVTSSSLKPATDYLVVFEPNGAAAPPACATTWTFRTAAAPVVAPSPVNFGAASSFAIAATAGASNTAATLINGDAVLNPTDTCNSVAVGGSGNFGLCGGAVPSINGTVVTPTYPNTTLAQQVTDALRAAYLSITPPSGPPAAGSLGGGTTLATTSIGAPTGSPAVAGLNYFTPGVYTSGSTITVAGDVTLDGGGDANAVFVFQAGSSITATPGAPTPAAHVRILLTNGAKASNVFWQAGASATIGNYADWNGNVLAGADITMQTLATSCGRMFAGAFTSGAFVFDHNVVSVPGSTNAPAGCL
ncbi:ice-binding family protein [Variovorax sp. J22R133]|uniref:ice-binding family protein n=1 Tax=Variovorax brevis TaxID=3053503 RepID=UPI0025767E51|nr:ice-binding family protein [Variovorax sp. J22R133]MDM0118091.1 ice-binding family protein [Variovorax sp. J22R133]